MSSAWHLSAEEIAAIREEALAHREKRGWHANLFERGPEGWWCCITSTLFCCAAGFVQSELEKGQTKTQFQKCFSGLGATSLMYAVCLPCAPCFMFNLRRRYRATHLIEDAGINDCRIGCLCAPCAASQMLRDYDQEEEIRKSAFDDEEIIKAHAARKAREKAERDRLRREKLSARAKLVIDAAFKKKKSRRRSSTKHGKHSSRKSEGGSSTHRSSMSTQQQGAVKRTPSKSDLKRMTSKANILVVREEHRPAELDRLKSAMNRMEIAVAQAEDAKAEAEEANGEHKEANAADSTAAEELNSQHDEDQEPEEEDQNADGDHTEPSQSAPEPDSAAAPADEQGDQQQGDQNGSSANAASTPAVEPRSVCAPVTDICQKPSRSAEPKVASDGTPAAAAAGGGNTPANAANCALM